MPNHTDEFLYFRNKITNNRKEITNTDIVFNEAPTKEKVENKREKKGRIIIPEIESIKVDKDLIVELLSQNYSDDSIKSLNKMIDTNLFEDKKENIPGWTIESQYCGLCVVKSVRKN